MVRFDTHDRFLVVDVEYEACASELDMEALHALKQKKQDNLHGGGCAGCLLLIIVICADAALLQTEVLGDKSQQRSLSTWGPNSGLDPGVALLEI